MRLLIMLLVLAVPGLASGQTFAGGCNDEGEELVCTARLPGQPGQRIVAWVVFNGPAGAVTEAVGSVSNCVDAPRALGTLPGLPSQGSRMLFLTEVQRAGAHCLRVVFRRCTLYGGSIPCGPALRPLRFEARLR